MLSSGFPFAEYIIKSLTRLLKCQRWMIEEAIQETWVDLIEDNTKVNYLLGYLLSHVRNRARNIRAKEVRYEKMKRKLCDERKRL